MRRCFLAGMTLVGCGGYDGPPCEDLTFTNMQAVVDGEALTFHWEGDRPNYLNVIEGRVVEDQWGMVSPDTGSHTNDTAAPLIHAWGIDCMCANALDGSDGPEGCRDRLDHELRACIPSGVAYGTQPEGTTMDHDPLPLEQGVEYTAFAGSYCHGERLPDDKVTFIEEWLGKDEVNTSGLTRIVRREAWVTFVAP